MTTKVLMIIFAILAGVSIAICFGGIIFGFLISIGLLGFSGKELSVIQKANEEQPSTEEDTPVEESIDEAV